MIQLVMPCTKNFTKETLIGRLESEKVDQRQFGDLARVETTLNTLNIWPNLTKSAPTHGDFASSKKYDEDKKIEEGITLPVRREKRW